MEKTQISSCWAASEKPLFVRTIWVRGGVRHALLEGELSRYRKRRRLTTSAPPPTTKKLQEELSVNLQECVKQQILCDKIVTVRSQVIIGQSWKYNQKSQPPPSPPLTCDRSDSPTLTDRVIKWLRLGGRWQEPGPLGCGAVKLECRKCNLEITSQSLKCKSTNDAVPNSLKYVEENNFDNEFQTIQNFRNPSTPLSMNNNNNNTRPQLHIFMPLGPD